MKGLNDYSGFTPKTACYLEPYDDGSLLENAHWHMKGTDIIVFDNISSLIKSSKNGEIDFIVCGTNQINLYKELAIDTFKKVNSVRSLFDDSYLYIYQRVDVSVTFLNAKVYNKVGTLGNSPNDVTCSIEAAKNWNKAEEIVAFPKFEYAVDELKAGKIDSVIIPCAYPDIRVFIMDEQLAVTETYFFFLPSLVFVSRRLKADRHYDVLYNHPATNVLIKETNVEFETNINVNSNTTACTEVLSAQSSCCAITNELCAKKYGLQIHKYLREKLRMPFLVFANKGDLI